MLKNNKGFSLVELMVVVAIIGILAAVAVPNINKYIARSKQGEAKANLASMYTANKAFFAEFQAFDDRFEVIGFNPEGGLRYNVGFAAGAGTECALNTLGYTAVLPAAHTTATTYCAATSGGTWNINGTPGGALRCGLLATAGPAGGGALNCVVGGNSTFTGQASGSISSSGTVDTWQINQDNSLVNTADGT